MKGGVKKIIVKIEKGKSETFSRKRKTKVLGERERNQEQGRRAEGESDFCRAFESSKFR